MQNNRNNGIMNNPYINTQNGVDQEAVQDIAPDTAISSTANPYYNTQIKTPAAPIAPTTLQSLTSSFDTGNFLKGALVGAIGAYLLTNEDAQKKIFKTFAKGADLFGAGIEEMKERLEDAKAELEAEREAK